MANAIRGEILAELGGKSWTLCLTLGALAELEASFGSNDLLALAERFETGRLASRDLVRIIAAGIRGAGNDVSDEDVASMASPNGASGYVEIVNELLQATFAPDEADA